MVQALGTVPAQAAVARDVDAHLALAGRRDGHHHLALHRQIGPGLVDTAFRRKGLHRIELGAGLIEQAVLHHGHRQTALVLQCHMGVENLVGIGEESVQVG